MPEPELSFEDAYKELTNWARSLLTTIEGSLPEIRDSLDPSTKLPENCPSHASLRCWSSGRYAKSSPK